MPLFSPPASSPVRWKWREVKAQSTSGQPRGVLKAAISAGWHWIPRELSPRGWGTEGVLSRGLGGGGDDDGYSWVDRLCLICTASCHVSFFYYFIFWVTTIPTSFTLIWNIRNITFYKPLHGWQQEQSEVTFTGNFSKHKPVTPGSGKAKIDLRVQAKYVVLEA